MPKNSPKKATLISKCARCGKKLNAKQVAKSLRELNRMVKEMEAKAGKSPHWFGVAFVQDELLGKFRTVEVLTTLC
jgi:hypothetical protein